MIVFVLEILGLLCLVAAGWLVTPALGLAVLGAATLMGAYALSRNTKNASAK